MEKDCNGALADFLGRVIAHPDVTEADELAVHRNRLFVLSERMVYATVDEGLFTVRDDDIEENLCPVFLGLPVPDFPHHFAFVPIVLRFHKTPIRRIVQAENPKITTARWQAMVKLPGGLEDIDILLIPPMNKFLEHDEAGQLFVICRGVEKAIDEGLLSSAGKLKTEIIHPGTVKQWNQFLNQFRIMLDTMPLSEEDYVVRLELGYKIILWGLIMGPDVLYESAFDLRTDILRNLRGADRRTECQTQ
jgi:hypothetical protein